MGMGGDDADEDEDERVGSGAVKAESEGAVVVLEGGLLPSSSKPLWLESRSLPRETTEARRFPRLPRGYSHGSSDALHFWQCGFSYEHLTCSRSAQGSNVSLGCF